jgi:hypothetical protein
MTEPACEWGAAKCSAPVVEVWKPKRSMVGTRPVKTMHFCGDHGVLGSGRAALVGARPGLSKEENVKKYQTLLRGALAITHTVEKYEPGTPTTDVP